MMLPPTIIDICEGRRKDLSPAQIHAYRRICEQAKQEARTYGGKSQDQELQAGDRALKEPVGTILKEIFDSLEIRIPGCEGCQGMLTRMNYWGVAGCRAEFDSLVSELRSRAEDIPLSAKIQGAFKAISSGLALKLNPLDPFPGLVTEAIRRAEVAAGLNDRTNKLHDSMPT